MAVGKRGVIYSAKKLRPKQPSAPSFFGQLKKRSPSGWVRFVLESIGKPIYWASVVGVVVVSYLLLVVAGLVSRITYHLSRLKLPRIKLPKIKVSKKWPLLIMGIGLFVFICLFVYLFILEDLPHPNGLVTRERIVSTKIYDRNGELLYKIYRNQNRTLVKLEDIPVSLVQATIAIEDAEFYHHYGFSAKGIIRSLLRNLRGGKLYGGSTHCFEIFAAVNFTAAPPLPNN